MGPIFNFHFSRLSNIALAGKYTDLHGPCCQTSTTCKQSRRSAYFLMIMLGYEKLRKPTLRASGNWMG